MKNIASIFTLQPKAIATAVAIAVCSPAVMAGDYTSNSATTPVIIAGDSGQNNSLTVTGANIGSVATPNTGGGVWPSLISVGGNNGVSPYDYGNITIEASNLSLFGQNTSTTGIEGIYAKTGSAGTTVKVDLSNSTISVGTSGLTQTQSLLNIKTQAVQSISPSLTATSPTSTREQHHNRPRLFMPPLLEAA